MDTARDLAGSIVHRYLTLSRYRRYCSHLIRKTTNVSGRQLAVLRHLVENAPLTVTEISRFLYVRDATASPLLERMEQAGYVTRRRCHEDSRKVHVEPTELGRQVALEAPMGIIELMRVRLPDLSVGELVAIDEALGKLSALVGVDESLLDRGSHHGGRHHL
ncbi:MAG TPA: MarR family transcriptional regulator [Anaerolineae bacterium]|nr:MarR family transcriptional regulator [Anaerolineae bacterium]